MSAAAAALVATRMRKVTTHLLTVLSVAAAADDIEGTLGALRPALAAHFARLLELTDASAASAPRPPRSSSSGAEHPARAAVTSPAIAAAPPCAAAAAARSGLSLSATHAASRSVRASGAHEGARPQARDPRGGLNVFGIWRAARAAAGDTMLEPGELKAAWRRVKASPTGRVMAALQARAKSLRQKRGLPAGSAVSVLSPPLAPTALPVTRALAPSFTGGGATATRSRTVARAATAPNTTPAAPTVGVPTMGAPTPGAAMVLLGMGRARSVRVRAR